MEDGGSNHSHTRDSADHIDDLGRYGPTMNIDHRIVYLPWYIEMWLYFSIMVLLLMTALFWRAVIRGEYDAHWWDKEGDDDGNRVRDIRPEEKDDRKRDLGVFRLLPGKSEFAPFENIGAEDARRSHRQDRDGDERS